MAVTGKGAKVYDSGAAGIIVKARQIAVSSDVTEKIKSSVTIESLAKRIDRN